MKLHEKMNGKPLFDHAAWGIRMGKLNLVEELWLEMGWTVCHRITEAPWGNAVFFEDPVQGGWFQFSERQDVNGEQKGDHPAVCVRNPVKWAEEVRTWLLEKGEDAHIIESGENRLVASTSIPLTIEFVIPE